MTTEQVKKSPIHIRENIQNWGLDIPNWEKYIQLWIFSVNCLFGTILSFLELLGYIFLLSQNYNFLCHKINMKQVEPGF